MQENKTQQEKYVFFREHGRLDRECANICDRVDAGLENDTVPTEGYM